MKQSMSFEATYTRYPFAPLVALGIAIVTGFKSVAGNAAAAPQSSGKSLIDSGQLAA